MIYRKEELDITEEKKKEENKAHISFMGIDFEKFVKEVVAELSAQKGLIDMFRDNLQHKIDLINNRINEIEDKKKFVRVDREDLVWLIDLPIKHDIRTFLFEENKRWEEIKKKYLME